MRFVAITALVLATLVGCGEKRPTVRIDGSSTVFPITEAVAEAFQKNNPDYRVAVGVSGTGGGFKKFVKGEIDINDASRPIKQKEMDSATAASIEFVELPVAYDGLTVVVHKDNDFVDYLTTEELNKIWKFESTVKTWADVRPGWPERKISFFAPGADSGTFDYFTDTINGESGSIRTDITPSEDDNVLVTGVAGTPSAIAFFGFVYYENNKDKVRAVPIANGASAKPVTPTLETINNGTYAPLSRKIYIYVSRAAADREEVSKFVDFYIENAPTMVSNVGYVPLPDAVYSQAKSRFAGRIHGAGWMENK